MTFLSVNVIQMDLYLAFSEEFLYLWCSSSISLYSTFWKNVCCWLMHRMAGREGFLMTSCLIWCVVAAPSFKNGEK